MRKSDKIILISCVGGLLLCAGLLLGIRFGVLDFTVPVDATATAPNVITAAVTTAPPPPETTETAATVPTEPVITEPEVSYISFPELPEEGFTSAFVEVTNILQNPELPTGCEITSLTMLLRFYGFDADKIDLADNYLPVSWGNAHWEGNKKYQDSFFDYFIGDPKGNGYGCFSPAIMTAAEKYLEVNDTADKYNAVNISGCTPDYLYRVILSGNPVMCWATDGMIAPEYRESWYDNETGEQLDWYLNEHAFLLVGFDTEKRLVYLSDPMKGDIFYSMDKFELRFSEMHRQAVIITESNMTLPEKFVSTTVETVNPETADVLTVST
jgi:uncharacterized protein YvpB